VVPPPADLPEVDWESEPVSAEPDRPEPASAGGAVGEDTRSGEMSLPGFEDSVGPPEPGPHQEPEAAPGAADEAASGPRRPIGASLAASDAVEEADDWPEWDEGEDTEVLEAVQPEPSLGAPGRVSGEGAGDWSEWDDGEETEDGEGGPGSLLLGGLAVGGVAGLAQGAEEPHGGEPEQPDAWEDLPEPPPFDPDLVADRSAEWADAAQAQPGAGTIAGDDEFDPMVLVERLEERPLVPPFDHEAPSSEYQADLGDHLYAAGGTIEHRDLAAEIARAGTGETELQALSAHMDGVHGGIVGFEDVEDLGADEDYYIAPPRSDLGARVVTGLVLVSLLLGSLFVGGEALAIFIGLIVLTGLVEFYGTLRARGLQPLTLFGLSAGAGMLAGTWFYGAVAIPAAILSLVVVVFFFYALVPGRRDALTNGGLTVLGVTWVTGTAAFAYPIVDAPEFRSLVMALVIATVAMDVGAYFVGKTWGSSHLAPILSPNKSIEGLAGGVVLAVIAAILFGRFFDPFTIRTGAWLGLIVAVLAPIGDLAESMVKRSLGVKDMGSILPGHGGILDRVDAFLYVLPAAWVLYTTTGLLG
jgi:phosphatidate cytidylyltransferase